MFTPRTSTFTPKVGAGSGNRSRPGSRRSSLLLSSSGVLNTSNRRRGPGTSSGVGTSFLQSSHILEETASFVVESFGSTLPVTVTEILTLSEKASDVSVRISPNGWAWLVHGRRLVVWRYTKSPAGSARLGAHCRELTLPPSDLAHDAKLVNVFTVVEGQTPSCLAVSPEGIVRYWPSIAHEGSSQETSADLQGQECCLLTDIQPVGSVLATTTATVVLVQRPEVSAASGGPHNLSCRQLKLPQGLLGGIGRRVSSLLWGGISSSTGSEAKLVQVYGAAVTDQDPTEKLVFVLTSNSFQKWLLAHGDPDRMYYNCDLESVAKQAFATHVWSSEKVDPAWVKVWLLDMAPAGPGKTSVLMAGHNPNISQQLHYAIGVLTTGTDAPPIQFRQFCVLKLTAPFNDPGQDQPNGVGSAPPGLNMRYLLPRSSNYQIAYLLSGNSVLCLSSVTSGDDHDEINLGNGGNSLLGTGYSESEALLFTLINGMITLKPTNVIGDELGSSVAGDISVTGADDRSSIWMAETLNMSMPQGGLENLTMSESKKDQLKAAFLLCCKGNLGQANAIIEELFPPSLVEGTEEPDSSMDKLVVSMSTDLIDDHSTTDPRWVESEPNMGSTSSLLILHQLQDKQVALDVFIKFLKDIGIWTRLSKVTVRGNSTPTTYLLKEHAEKISVAIKLRTIHPEFQDLVDMAIKKTLKHRAGITTGNNLTPQDHFYREVSKIQEFFIGLTNLVEEDILVSNVKGNLGLDIASVNHIMMTLMKTAVVMRNNEVSNEGQGEVVSWTSSLGPQGMRAIMIRQFLITLERVVPIVPEEAGTLVQQLVEFVDLILDGYQVQLDSIKDPERKAAVLKQFEKDRSKLVMPLLDHPGSLEDAASLAEKYLEFSAMVKVCEITNDNERLERYMDVFSEHNFAHFVFDWHLRQGKQSKLLQQRTYNSGKRQNQLGEFLSGHSQISWLHSIQTGNYAESSATLKRLADDETDLTARKKTMMSLSKLCALASDESEDVVVATVKNINKELDIITAQTQLPKCILESMEIEDPLKMKILTARELIELYIGEDNIEADHVDFKKALDLLDYVVPLSVQDFQEEKAEIKLRIWATAVSRNCWDDMDTAEPIDAIKDTLFFRLVDFCHLQGLDLNEEMPSADNLLGHEKLKEPSAKMTFLIQTGYEHIQRQLMAH